MADPRTMTHLRERIADHLVAVEALFIGPRKITILVRDPARPDGSRDVFLTDDDVEAAVAAIRRVVATGEETPRG